MNVSRSASNVVASALASRAWIFRRRSELLVVLTWYPPFIDYGLMDIASGARHLSMTPPRAMSRRYAELRCSPDTLCRSGTLHAECEHRWRSCSVEEPHRLASAASHATWGLSDSPLPSSACSRSVASRMPGSDPGCRG